MERNEIPLFLNPVKMQVVDLYDDGEYDCAAEAARTLTKNLLYECSKKPRTVAELSNALGVSAQYVDDELKILTGADDGESDYPFVRAVYGGRRGEPRFLTNILLLDAAAVSRFQESVSERTREIADDLAAFAAAHKAELATGFDWEQVCFFTEGLEKRAEMLAERSGGFPVQERKKTVCVGVVENTVGWRGVYRTMTFTRKERFGYAKIRLNVLCGGVFAARQERLARFAVNRELECLIRALPGRPADNLSEREREYAANLIADGWLAQRDGSLYTDISVCTPKREAELRALAGEFADTQQMRLAEIAQTVAQELARVVPKHLAGDWRAAARILLPFYGAEFAEHCMENGALQKPSGESGGVWLTLEK